MPVIGHMEFEITARRSPSGFTNVHPVFRTFVVNAIDIDDAALAAVKQVEDDEVVVQVRDVTYDPAAAAMDADQFDHSDPYRIVVDGDEAYADTLDAALLAAHTLIADGVGEEVDRREQVAIFLHGIRNAYASALARRGCKSETDFQRQEITALGER